VVLVVTSAALAPLPVASPHDMPIRRSARATVFLFSIEYLAGSLEHVVLTDGKVGARRTRGTYAAVESWTSRRSAS
jgi:hypothetical protein